jgi:hypothetical protein
VAWLHCVQNASVAQLDRAAPKVETTRSNRIGCAIAPNGNACQASISILRDQDWRRLVAAAIRAHRCRLHEWDQIEIAGSSRGGVTAFSKLDEPMLPFPIFC